MKTYAQLPPAQQAAAVDKALGELLLDLTNGAGMTSLPADSDLRQGIAAAIVEAERGRTPWFAREHIMDKPELAAKLRAVARARAENTMYWE